MPSSKVLAGENPGGIARTDHREWYRELFEPCVVSGLIPASALAGYRNDAVYLRNSRYVPPRWETVRDAMLALFDLIKVEPEPSVRDRDGIRIALVIQEPWHTYNSVEIGAGGISAEGDGEQFKSAFLLSESKTVNSPEALILAGRSRDKCGQRGYCVGNPERSEVSLSVDIEIKVQMSLRGDDLFGAFAADRAKRLGIKADLGSRNTDLEPA
jgi:hypothetical protein